MSQIYIHPELTSSPELVAALEERLGMKAIIDGHRVRLDGKPKPKGRPMPARLDLGDVLLDILGGAIEKMGGTREHAARAMRGHDEGCDDE